MTTALGLSSAWACRDDSYLRAGGAARTFCRGRSLPREVYATDVNARMRSTLLGVTTVLLCGYLLGPQGWALEQGGFRLDLAAVGLRVMEWKAAEGQLRGFGVADLHEPVSAEDYVGIATILLALATVALAVQTRLLGADSKRQIEELRHAETRRSIVELRQHVHTVNVAAINLSSAHVVAASLTKENVDSPTVADVLQSTREAALNDCKRSCQALYPRMLAIVDDLPFVTNDLREDVNHAMVTLSFLTDRVTLAAVRDATADWARVRIKLLTAIDAFQGRQRTWKSAEDILTPPEEEEQAAT